MLRIIFALLMAALFTVTSAQTTTNSRNLSQQQVGATIASMPSGIYSFATYYMDSADGQRHYKVQLAIPKKPAPNQGYRVIYMLDGNAAMATLSQQDVLNLNRQEPTVLVAIGYDVNTRNDPVARAYDYTPPVYESGHRVAPVVLGKAGGGADKFLHILQTRIIPLVNKRLVINKQKSVFWGHSFGGLFVLYTLSQQPDLFNYYVAADPSVWWYNGVFTKNWSDFDTRLLAGKNIAILTGTKPRTRPSPYEIDAAAHKNRIYKDPGLILQNIIHDMAKAGARLQYITYPQADHGAMISKSLDYVINGFN